MNLPPEFKKENEANIKKYESVIEETEGHYALAKKNEYGEKELKYFTDKIQQAKGKLQSCLENRVRYADKKDKEKKVIKNTLDWGEL